MAEDNLDFNEKYCRRTKRFALAVIRLVRQQAHDYLNDRLLGQLMRSGTSVASNFRTVTHSLKERYSKFSIVTKELDESIFRIEFLTEAEVITTDTTPYNTRRNRIAKGILFQSQETQRKTKPSISNS